MTIQFPMDIARESKNCEYESKCEIEYRGGTRRNKMKHRELTMDDPV
jgi:hypothetical protein